MFRSAFVLAFALTLAACQPAAPEGPVTEAGDLDLGDLTLQSGEYYDTYTVSMKADQWLSVNIQSTDFDPYLIVRTPSGEQSDLDDSEESNTTSVESVIRAQEAGSWEIVVTSYETGESGAYQVTYEVSDAAPAGSASSSAPAEEAVEDADAVEV